MTCSTSTDLAVCSRAESRMKSGMFISMEAKIQAKGTKECWTTVSNSLKGSLCWWVSKTWLWAVGVPVPVSPWNLHKYCEPWESRRNCHTTASGFPLGDLLQNTKSISSLVCLTNTSRGWGNSHLYTRCGKMESAWTKLIGSTPSEEIQNKRKNARQLAKKRLNEINNQND